MLVPGNARLKYELVLTLDRFDDGHVSGVVEWPSDISRSPVTGELDGQRLTLVDASGDRMDALVSVEKRGGCEPDRATLSGTDKNGLWQLTAVADRTSAPLKETGAASR